MNLRSRPSDHNISERCTMIHTVESENNKPGRAGVSTQRSAIAAAALMMMMILMVAAVLPVSAQDAKLMKFFQDGVALTPDQIAAIRRGEPVAKNLPSRAPAEVFLFGAIYIHATPESYLKLAQDFDRLRKLPNYLALGVFSNPPQASDLKNFSFDNDDIKALKNCKPGDCLIQMPASSIEALQSSIDFSAADVGDQVNRQLQKTALQRLLDYHQQGNPVLGVYNDKPAPTEVPQQFAFMLSYSKALPENLPDFYLYLLDYPDQRRVNCAGSRRRNWDYET
jgi:hypothetical protein